MAKTDSATMAAKVAELRKELQRLIKAIVDEKEDDVRVENYDRAKEIVLVLKELKIKKNKSSSPYGKVDVPDLFRCPISKEVMLDPVIVANGKTFDRPFIQAILDSGCRICPVTEEVLSHTNLIPNDLVKKMILQWCKDHAVELPSPVQEVGISKGDRNQFDSLLEKLTMKSPSEQKQAAKELRLSTKKMSSFRALFGESQDAITQLVLPLKDGKVDSHPDLQEDLITTVLNLSIRDENKKLVGENPLVISLLVESLSEGTIQTKTNAAGALFTLSALDSNKVNIGRAGALKPLIQLLEEEHPLAMKDVSQAIFTLCINHKNKEDAVNHGAVKVIMKKIIRGVLVDELLATLALLSSYEKAVEDMCAHGAVPCLLNIIRVAISERNKENCIAILYTICYSDRTKLKEVREEEQSNGTISKLAENGNSRARRKANGILERLQRSGFLTHTA